MEGFFPKWVTWVGLLILGGRTFVLDKKAFTGRCPISATFNIVAGMLAVIIHRSWMRLRLMGQYHHYYRMRHWSMSKIAKSLGPFAARG